MEGGIASFKAARGALLLFANLKRDEPARGRHLIMRSRRTHAYIHIAQCRAGSFRLFAETACVVTYRQQLRAHRCREIPRGSFFFSGFKSSAVIRLRRDRDFSRRGGVCIMVIGWVSGGN